MPARTWILTGSPENLAATRAHGFGVIGLKERRRRQALELEQGDRIVFYVTRVMAFAASALITGALYEDRTPIWPGKPGKADPYPWRFPAEGEWVLDEPAWIPAESLVDQLDHIAKWPREHWKLAFQGQLRPVDDHDAELLCTRLADAAAALTAAR
ncbi:MAG: EVE domain-containing protein [Solirubrobacteraceae bacterium]